VVALGGSEYTEMLPKFEDIYTKYYCAWSQPYKSCAGFTVELKCKLGTGPEVTI